MTAAAKSQEAFAAKEVAALKAQLEGFEEHLAFKGSGAVGGKYVALPFSLEMCFAEYCFDSTCLVLCLQGSLVYSWGPSPQEMKALLHSSCNRHCTTSTKRQQDESNA